MKKNTLGNGVTGSTPLSESGNLRPNRSSPAKRVCLDCSGELPVSNFKMVIDSKRIRCKLCSQKRETERNFNNLKERRKNPSFVKASLAKERERYAKNRKRPRRPNKPEPFKKKKSFPQERLDPCYYKDYSG